MSIQVVFLGHGGIAEGCLRAIILDEDFRVSGVFIHHSVRKDDREAAILITNAAESGGCPVYEVSEMDLLKIRLEELRPDLLVCVGFMKILPGEVLALPRYGCINLHGALLPRYRGRAPISRAIMNGDTVAGATVHYMDEGIDSGDIIVQARINIALHDDALTLFEKVRRLSPSLLLEAMKQFRSGPPVGISQSDPEAAAFGKITPEECLIRWDEPAIAVHNRVRALVRPYPGAITTYRGEKYFVWKSQPVGSGFGEYKPGEVLKRDPGGVLVGTGENCLYVEKVQAERGAVKTPDWAVGEFLG